LIFVTIRLITATPHHRSHSIFVPQKSPHMPQANKIALVTGGSRGLGKDMAIRLAEKGLDVIISFNTVNGQRIEASGGMAL
jgi:hypothetical protein